MLGCLRDPCEVFSADAASDALSSMGKAEPVAQVVERFEYRRGKILPFLPGRTLAFELSDGMWVSDAQCVCSPNSVRCADANQRPRTEMGFGRDLSQSCCFHGKDAGSWCLNLLRSPTVMTVRPVAVSDHSIPLPLSARCSSLQYLLRRYVSLIEYAVCPWVRHAWGMSRSWQCMHRQDARHARGVAASLNARCCRGGTWNAANDNGHRAVAVVVFLIACRPVVGSYHISWPAPGHPSSRAGSAPLRRRWRRDGRR